MTADSHHLTDLDLFELLDDMNISHERLEKYRYRMILAEIRQTKKVEQIEPSEIDGKSLTRYVVSILRLEFQINPRDHSLESKYTICIAPCGVRSSEAPCECFS